MQNWRKKKIEVEGLISSIQLGTLFIAREYTVIRAYDFGDHEQLQPEWLPTRMIALHKGEFFIYLEASSLIKTIGFAPILFGNTLLAADFLNLNFSLFETVIPQGFEDEIHAV